MRWTKVTVLLLVLVLACTAFIFSNSLKDSAASHSDSDGIVKVVERVAKTVLPQNRLNWNYIVRKGAHIFEFFLLGLCTVLFVFRWNADRWKQLVVSFLYVLLIASSDEFIQRFTGRSSRIADVFIDLIGAVVGIGLIFFISVMLQCRRRKQRVCKTME